jgi:uncharacterized protein
MKLTGKCKKLRVYVDEDFKNGIFPLYQVILGIFLKEGLAGATIFKGIEGFGSHHHIHKARIIRTEQLPMVIEAVEKSKKLLKVLNQIEEILPPHCLVTLQDEEVIHYHSPNGKHTKTKKFK